MLSYVEDLAYECLAFCPVPFFLRFTFAFSFRFFPQIFLILCLKLDSCNGVFCFNFVFTRF